MALSSETIDATARLLTDARRAGTMIHSLGNGTPTSNDEADAIADAHASQLGWNVVGWKIGCTSELAMEILNSPGPFAGRIFEGNVHPSGDVVHRPRPLMVESEFAFTIGETIEPRDGEWEVDEIKAHTASVAPALEVLSPRIEGFGKSGYLDVLADSGGNEGVVLGTPAAVSDALDLASIPVRCEVDGETTGEGTGADVLGDPWNALVWLANHLGGRGITLDAGQIVLSGTCTGVASVPVGSTVVVDYGPMGTVTATSG
ncbi:MAG: hypothetical protein HKN94_13150 [Acidimicrobiales bacterium]|nr:hypothetical protein [Acidimicrobiales bacterium]